MRLQSKLLLAIVPVIALALLTIGWVVYGQLRQSSEEEVLREMDLRLEQSLQRARLFVDAVRSNAQLFSSAPLIETYLRSGPEEQVEARRALTALFGRFQAAYPEYHEIRLIRADGREDIRLTTMPTDTDPDRDESNGEWYAALQGSDERFHARLSRNLSDGHVDLLAVHGIRAATDATASREQASDPLGYLAIAASASFLRTHVAEQSIARNGYLLAADQNGRLLVDQSGTVGVAEFQALLNRLRRHTAAGGKAVLRVNFKGVPVLIGERWLDDDLQLLAVVPESDLAAEGNRLALIVGLVTVVATYLTTLFFFVFLRSLVLGPLMRLQRMATAIGDGQLDTTIDIHRADEIGDLAAAFQEMSEKLTISMRDQQRSHARIEQLAYLDSLTGLPNRRLFMDVVTQAIGRRRRDDSGLAVLFLDLDDFKRVNDTEGHDAGDVLLQEVARRLQSCIRMSDAITSTDSAVESASRSDAWPEPNDDAEIEPIDQDESSLSRVARLGGDEFIILLADLNQVSDATQVAERIIEALQRPIELNGRQFVVGTSIGISTYPADASDVDGLIKCADTAMYEAKRKSKNTYMYFGDSEQFSLNARLELENELRTALRDGGLTLAYQPQYGKNSHELVGVEALLRWTHAVRGNIAPTSLIPLAEESGLIGELGEWVLREACRQWQSWNQQGVAPKRIAVNVSHRQFRLCKMIKVVTRALDDHDVPGHALELELTESSMMEASDELVDTLKTLRAMGVRIAMDDFGTGFSALGVLSALPLDRLKIDRNFIEGIERDTPNDKIVSAVITLARGLNLETVAEGVETDRELHHLRDLQCDVFQGYLLGRPLPASELTALLTRYHQSPELPFRRAG